MIYHLKQPVTTHEGVYASLEFGYVPTFLEMMVPTQALMTGGLVALMGCQQMLLSKIYKVPLEVIVRLGSEDHAEAYRLAAVEINSRIHGQGGIHFDATMPDANQTIQ